jgi:hypothetical protein
MTRVFLREFIFIFLCASALFADTTIVDRQLDYRMFLPNNWVREVKSDSQHFFVDTAYFYPAQLCLRRYIIDTVMYRSAVEWTQAHFLAYKLSVQYSVDPAGVLLYSNSDSTVKQGSLQASEAYSIFFSSDITVGCWSEYVRFTAFGKYGYEMYAISDTADMSRNIGLYAALLQGIVIAPLDHVISPRVFRRNISLAEKNLSRFMCDPLGRQIQSLSATRYLAPGIYFRRYMSPRFLVR